MEKINIEKKTKCQAIEVRIKIVIKKSPHTIFFSLKKALNPIYPCHPYI